MEEMHYIAIFILKNYTNHVTMNPISRIMIDPEGGRRGVF